MASLIHLSLEAGQAPADIKANMGLSDIEYERLTTSDASFLAIQAGRDKAMASG